MTQQDLEDAISDLITDAHQHGLTKGEIVDAVAIIAEALKDDGLISEGE